MEESCVKIIKGKSSWVGNMKMDFNQGEGRDLRNDIIKLQDMENRVGTL